ncbi:DUF4007 family protein [Allocoprobacillus halotolerans]|uniref:DUF4007 family protein n=1 Tax=Allocoprobacillus halotolerans TaxID=2944914 RepID=A0ABY5I1T2_9FIRM|nr:DUF4007 family protein [Allocoprobacillus halotolerans]UTY39276.1 DUF4007 family protein [Allocoprobacillus halotolerans]
MKTKFKGHETFYFREGWLSKALFNMIDGNSTTMFSHIKDGVSKLGVGANMVKSIKYWLTVTGLIRYRGRGYCLTQFGQLISNYDLYIENELTLWLLHFHLCTNRSEATTWYLFWNEFKAESFETKDVEVVLTNYLNNNQVEFKESALKNDIGVLLNMYSKTLGDDDPEENIVCPLSKLNLITQNQNVYEKKIPILQEGHEIIILYILSKSKNEDGYTYLEQGYMKLSQAEEILNKYMNLNRLLVNEYIDMLKNKYIKVENTAGLDMIYFNENLDVDHIIEEYYERGMNL